ncbi:MAG TPA: DNA primase [Acidimicrobiales bacterium]|nr:DNA primase [Acidimicrobiales bacterium]
MGIVEEDIAKVRASTDFVALAGEHLALKRVGSRWVGLCPFHAENSPSFSLNAELGFYYCFGCGAKGDVITFVREIEHLDFVEAVERLAGRAGISLRYDDQGSGGRDHQRRSRIQDTLEKAIEWYHQRLLSGPDSSDARAYLRRERGYDGDVVRRYRLGWAPDGWDTLVRDLGVPARDLVDAGLATLDRSGRHTDFFRARILFPIFEPGGRPVGGGGRALPGGRPPKYKNTAATAVYDKSRVLYGLNWAKKAVVDKGRVVVCEGYTDVIGLQQAGVAEAVATCGTALADGHIRLLTNFARRIVLAYDADTAGQAAAERFYEWEDRFQVDIRVAAIPAGADPADLAGTDPEALSKAVDDAQPFLGFRLDRLFARSDLSSPELRARAAGEAMAMIREHPNELVRDQYLMQVADRCRVDPDRLRTMEPVSGRAPGGRQRPEGRNDAGPAEGSPVRLEPILLSGPELEALRLAVHRPEEVASRMETVLFDHPLARAAFDVLVDASTFHEAVEAADPQTADLLQRLAAEDATASADDVMTRLVERAGQRALRDLQSEMRQGPLSEQGSYPATIAWLKLTLEEIRSEDPSTRNSAVEAEERLIRWLVARNGEARQPEAAHSD